ncbi:Isoprenyl transferase [Sedimentisphaera cyanobacteriorum]|uniref:Isoprenyl transferase n=1 Tax=Sedimentisphaera cyanobacteriorum TaxID=1940790 RepID=A0A1Q2HR99_9BACT|nr:polyprenyl diphosphate synthase [Sedimentisphaera cyanobacteriorum]AQQ09794.1 Isoprenyl transferase [Sedimentisphaera cyanobacteriorum]
MKNDFEAVRKQAAEKFGLPAEKIPRHIGIIMDGNGRWAKQRDLPRFHGHREGAKKIEIICDAAQEIGCECVTLYCFSVQNWRRPEMEIDYLMQLFTRYLVAVREDLVEKNMKLAHFGRREGLPDFLLEELDNTLEATKSGTGLTLGLCLNYGGREEIADAVKRLGEKISNAKLSPEEITEQMISENIYTSEYPDPDLIIRTSSEMRISNFLLWQSSYAEYYVTKTLWPDFTREEMFEAVKTIGRRERRMGDIKA